MNLPARLLPLLFAVSTLSLSQMLFPGCATLVDGPTERVQINSRPAGARVFLNGRLIGPAPTTVVVSRWGLHRLRIEMPGYQPLEIPLEKKFNSAAGGNLFIGGVWIVVDALTGSIFALDVPAKSRAELKPQLQVEDFTPFLLGSTTLTITMSSKPDPAARPIGRLEPLRF